MNSRLSSASMSVGHVPAADRLPLSGLLALALTGFIAMLTEVLPAGLLPQIGRGLAVSDALAGQLMTLYALGALLTAIPLTTATRGMRRRPLLLLAITGFLVFNTITVLSSSYTLTLTARFFAGMAAGLTWSLIGGYARRMVAVPLQGRALSVAMIGIPLALSIGVPLGTWSGALAGWRTPFAIISGLALILVVWVLTKVPDFPGQATHQRMPLRQVFAMPGMRSVLFVVLAWMLAHNIFYIYIIHFLTPAGLAHQVDFVLLVFGISALLGIWVIGLWVDHRLRALVLLSLGVFIVIVAALQFSGTLPLVVYAAVAAWGFIFGGAPTLLQTASADTAGENADTAQSMVVTAWNLAIAGGGAVGGALLATKGVVSFTELLLTLLLLGFFVAWRAGTHGFIAGKRAALQ